MDSTLSPSTPMAGQSSVAVTPAGATSGLPLSFGRMVSDPAGDTLHVSGMVGYALDTGALVGPGLVEQAEVTLRNVQAVVEAAGMTLEDVTVVRVFLADIQRDFAAFNEVYRTFFPGPHFPARTALGVTLADPALLVEVDAIAHRPRRSGP